MLGLILDAAVMYGIIAAVSGETPEFLTALLISLGFAVAMFVSFLALGLAGGLIALLPLVILFGAILSAIYGMPLNRAIIGSAVFLVYKIVMAFVWAGLMS
jgi:hypothetical protein